MVYVLLNNHIAMGYYANLSISNRYLTGARDVIAPKPEGGCPRVEVNK